MYKCSGPIWRINKRTPSQESLGSYTPFLLVSTIEVNICSSPTRVIKFSELKRIILYFILGEYMYDTNYHYLDLLLDTPWTLLERSWRSSPTILGVVPVRSVWIVSPQYLFARSERSRDHAEDMDFSSAWWSHLASVGSEITCARFAVPISRDFLCPLLTWNFVVICRPFAVDIYSKNWIVILFRCSLLLLWSFEYFRPLLIAQKSIQWFLNFEIEWRFFFVHMVFELFRWHFNRTIYFGFWWTLDMHLLFREGPLDL